MSAEEFNPRSVAQRIDAALTGPHFMTAVRPLQAGLDADDPLRPRLFPLDYRLDDDQFVPIWEGADGTIYPPYIPTVNPEVVEDWALLADEISEPAGWARYHDVLWVARHGNPGRHARLAIEGYREAAEQERWNSILPTEWLERSLTLAKQINAPELVPEIAEQMIGRGLAALNADTPKPGVVLGFLEPLVGLSPADRPGGMDAALERAFELFSDSAFLAEEIAQLRARLLGEDSEAGRAVLLEGLASMVADAKRSESGLRRRALLDQALRFATVHGLTEVQGELVAAIEAITEEDLDLQAITAEVEVDREPIDRLVGQLSGGADWAEVIVRLAAFGPLVGDPAERIAEATAQMQEFPLTAIVSPVVIGQFGETIFRPTTDEERLDLERVRLESIGLQFWGTIIADALDQAQARLGDPNPDELAAALEAAWSPPGLAAKFARAIAHFLAGDFDESVLVSLPRIEALVRNLAREAGVEIIRNHHESHQSGLRTLGELLFGGLQQILEPHLHRHLYVMLIKPTGLNLRNNHLHGIAPEGDRVSAALLIQTVAVLTHLQKGTHSDT